MKGKRESGSCTLKGTSSTVMERWTSHAAMMLPRIYRWLSGSRGRSPQKGAAYPRVHWLRLVDDVKAAMH